MYIKIICNKLDIHSFCSRHSKRHSGCHNVRDAPNVYITHLTTLEANNIFWVAGSLAKIDLSLKPSPNKVCKSAMHSV